MHMKTIKNNYLILLSFIAIIISIAALLITLFYTNFKKDADASNYITIAVTLLTIVVGSAVGNNIYMNLAGTRKMTEDIAKKMVDKSFQRLDINQAASGNYIRANMYYELGFFREEVPHQDQNDKVLESFKDALRACKEAKRLFTQCENFEMVYKCDEFIDKLDELINLKTKK